MKTGRETVPLPGGIADPAGRTGFLANPSGGIDALDLATGRLLWSSGEAWLPLILLGDLLVAAENAGARRARLIQLDTKAGGRRLAASAELVFPRQHWSITAVLRGEDGSLLVDWESYNSPNPGPPTSEEYNRREQGSARVDLRSGRVEMPARVAGEEPTAPEPPELPAGLTPYPNLEGSTRPWRAGIRFAAVALAGGRLVLQTWDASTRQAQPPVELLQHPPPFGSLQIHVSADRDHVVLLVCNTAETGSSCRWLAFTVATGERVLDRPQEPETEVPFALLGGRALYAVAVTGGAAGLVTEPARQPRLLKAVELHSSRPLWERQIVGRPLPAVASP